MPDTTPPVAESQTIQLEGSWTIERAGELKNLLLKALGESDVQISVHNLTEIDLACLQVLCSAHRTFTQQQRHLRLDFRCPPAFREVLRAAGYARQRGCRSDMLDSCLWKGGWSE